MTRRESLQSIALVAASLFGVVALGEGVGDTEKSCPFCFPKREDYIEGVTPGCACVPVHPLWASVSSSLSAPSWGTLAQEGIL